jgi:hypothetical protein
MALLEDYKQCLTDIAECESEMKRKKYSLDTNQYQIVDVDESIQKVNRDNKDYKEQAIKNYTATKLQQVVSPMEEQFKVLKGNLDSIPNQLGSETNRILNKDYNYKAVNVISELTDTYNVIQKYYPLFEKYESVDLGSIISDYVNQSLTPSMGTLKAIKMYIINSMDEMDLVEPTSKLHRVFDKLIIHSEQLSKLKNTTRLIVYSVYIIGILLAILLLPVLFFSLYLSILVMSCIDFYKHEKKILEVVLPFKQLIFVYDEMQKQTTEFLNQCRSQEMNRTTQRYDELNESLRNQLVELGSQIQTAKRDINSNTNEDEAVTEYNSKCSAELAHFVSVKEELTNKQTVIQSDINNLNNRLNELTTKRSSLKTGIIDTYLKVKTPGDSQILPVSFFLGIRENGELIEFNYNRNTTVILYDGNSEDNTSLITMMIMQLLSSMSIMSLDITLFDLKCGCSDYAVFALKEDSSDNPVDLADIFHFVTSKEKMTKCLTSNQSEMQYRNKLILSKADDINIYNDEMIKNDSLTSDYRILFFQDFEYANTIGNESFLQLCRVGPRVGIIPIVFLPLDYISKSEQNNNSTACKQLVEFFQASSDSIFWYGDGQLQDYSPEFRPSLIEDLRKNIKDK